MAQLSTQFARLRKQKSLPATRVSDITGFDVSGIYAFEGKRRDARVSTVEAIADAIGARMLVVDTDHRGSTADAAEEIRAALAVKRPDIAAQVLVQVTSDLTALDPFPTLALCYEKPSAVDAWWDAALAGIVELCLSRRGLPFPAWTAQVTGVADARWDPWTEGAIVADPANIPDPLRQRGIWIEESELASA